MPPLRMTRAEYEAQYGTKPVVATSTLDNDPIPVRMTRAEYNAMYRPTESPRDNSFVGDLKAGFKGAVSAIDRGTEQQNELQNRGLLSRNLGRFTTGLEAAGGALGSIGEGIFRAVPGGTTVANTVGDITESGIKAVSESGLGQATKAGFEMLPEGVQTTLSDVGKGTLGALGVGGALVAPGATGAIARPVARTAQETIGGLARRATQPQNTAVQRVANEIADIENNYAKTRRKIDSDPTTAESRARIAQSNVLEGAVDNDGLIRTKQSGGAIERYRSTPITEDGLTLMDVEDVVRRNLETENKSINVNEIRAKVYGAVMDSGLEGGDLASAIRRIDRDLEGLIIRADEIGNILLSKIQDAKISTTKNIDYTKPVGTTYRKTLARVYKEIIEDKSDLPVKEWNKELQKYYKDIDRLADLDGKRVKGGRLGKYTANVAGSAVGAVAGAAGGGPGALIGGIVGGEIAGAIKGRAMAGTFGRGIDARMPQSELLGRANVQAGIRDLSKPDPQVGASKSFLSDPDLPQSVKKEVVKVETQIKSNVKQQKAAIADGDFTLVEALKDVYQILVDRLKQIIADYKKMSPRDKQSGHIKNPLYRERNDSQANAKAAPANPQNISSNVQTKEKLVKLTEGEKEQTLDALNAFDETPLTVIEEVLQKRKAGYARLPKSKGATPQTTSLLEEAKKYKSAEEFVKANYRIRNVLIPESGKVKYKLAEIYNNEELYNKYPIIRGTNIRFVSRRNELLNGANGLAVGNDIVIADDLIKKTADVRQVEKLEKELAKYLEKEASGTLTDAEYKTATKLTDEISQLVNAPGATVELTDDALRVIAHELQHIKQGVGGKGVKRDIKEDVLAEFARKNPQIDMSDYYGDPAELEARMAEGKIKTREELKKIWEEAKK